MEENQTLENRLSKWLETQGYPLEMRVERVLRKAGFKTIPSDYYIDLQSHDSREIDIYAHRQRDIEKTLFRVSICVECKSSKEKPWVVFTSEEVSLAAPACVVQRASTPHGRAFLTSVCQNKNVQDLSMFQLPRRPAYSITQAFTSGNDVAYSACLSVSKCASSKANEDNQRLQRRAIAEIVIPIIVIEGKLFESYLTEEGETVVTEIKSSTLLWRNRLTNAAHTIIKITTEDEFPNIVRDISEGITYLFAMETELKEGCVTRPPVRIL